MAREIAFSHDDYSGSNALYAIAFLESNSNYAVPATPALEAFDVTHWTTYAIVLTLNADTNYYGDFPLVPNGAYLVKIYERLGASPQTTDNELAEGEYLQEAYPSPFKDILAIDAAAFINEFAEPLVYTSKDNNNSIIETVTIQAVIDRNPPALISEDGKTLANTIEISIMNDLTLGRSTINPGRDSVFCSGRYGGLPKNHLVTLVTKSDSGIFTLRAR